MNASNPLLDGIDESAETTTAVVNVRPVIDVPQHLRMLKCSFWAATEEKKAQYGGWSPDMNMYVRIYGDLAEQIFEHYGAALVAGEETGAKVSLMVETHPASNGLFFKAQTEAQRDYVSLNEYSVASLERWTPSVQFK